MFSSSFFGIQKKRFTGLVLRCKKKAVVDFFGLPTAHLYFFRS